MNNLINWMKILSDENRLRILFMLKERPLCACEMLEVLEITGATLSSHLKLMRLSGLLNHQKEGKWIIYSLGNNNFIKLLDHLANILDTRDLIDADIRKIRELSNRDDLCRSRKIP